jgi:hypothetical protein
MLESTALRKEAVLFLRRFGRKLLFALSRPTVMVGLPALLLSSKSAAVMAPPSGSKSSLLPEEALCEAGEPGRVVAAAMLIIIEGRPFEGDTDLSSFSTAASVAAAATGAVW